MHRVINGRVPLNIFTSTGVETYQWLGALDSVAYFHVVPGASTTLELAHAIEGKEAVLVLYNSDVRQARQWLYRASQGVHGMNSVPVLVVCTGTGEAQVGPLLRAYRNAEHAVVRSLVASQDCINRIVMRARRDLPSPLQLRRPVE